MTTKTRLLFISLLFYKFTYLYAADCSETVTIWIPHSCQINGVNQQANPPLIPWNGKRNTLFVFDLDETLLKWNSLLERCQLDALAIKFIKESKEAYAQQFLTEHKIKNEELEEAQLKGRQLTDVGFIVAQLRIFNMPFIALTHTRTVNAPYRLRDGSWDEECACVFRYNDVKNSVLKALTKMQSMKPLFQVMIHRIKKQYTTLYFLKVFV